MTYEGQILDGRNRWRACEAAQLSSRPMREYVGTNPLAEVLSLNLHRRHLDESQRAMVAAKIANLRDGQRADQAASIDAPAISQSTAAEMLNVGRAFVQRAREVIERGAPEIVRAVESGRVSVSASFTALTSSGAPRSITSRAR